MKKLTKMLTILMVITGLLLIVSAQITFAEKEGEIRGDPKYKFFLANVGAPHPFWAVFENGMNDASKLLNVSTVLEYSGGDDAKQVDMVYTAIAEGADGIGVNIQNDTAFDVPVQEALDAGIPVIAFNTDDSEHAAGNPRLAYIGQDFVEAGYAIGKYMAKLIPEGSNVVCPVEIPGAVYAVSRYEGVKKALDEANIKSEVLDSGFTSLSETLTRLESYLLGHPEVDAILAMGGMPHEMAPQALDEIGLKNVIVGGFDITPKILEYIKNGKSVAAVDQQGYVQGFYTVMQLYLAVAGSISPCDMNTGSAIIDKSNIEAIEAVIGKYR
jgi:ABC-type sugar transport system substrate-binding protein